MDFFDRLHRFLRYLDTREQYRLLGAVLGGAFVLIAIFMYSYFAAAHGLQRRIKAINQKRSESLAILAKYELVMEQQKSVDALLQKDPNFIIKHFFNLILQELNLNTLLKKEPEVTSQPLVGEYRELRLEARLSGLSMKQVVDLLDRIEKNERVYVKEITISASKQQRALDIVLTIATFEANAAP